MYQYKATVLRVIDGDSLELLIDQGFRQYRREKVRLLECDSPEVTGKEKPLGLEVEKKLTDLLEMYNNEVFIQTKKQDSFGRWLCYMSTFADHKDTINQKVREWTADAWEKEERKNNKSKGVGSF